MIMTRQLHDYNVQILQLMSVLVFWLLLKLGLRFVILL